MSSDAIAIQVEGVSKRFEIYPRPRDQLKQLVLPRLRRMAGLEQRQYFHEFWALQDVSFAVARGESCGIVGLNGSGKSTLLQIITGTLTPTRGQVRVHGRIAALLELGSGFNPEFSGRENATLNGALQGFTPEQVAARMPEIEAFADIGEHFDRPLSTYSSGMQVRVAFAVATAFDPDILVVDEALAVGDAYFQQKCFHRLEQLKKAGGTLLFVSHDAATVKHLCDRAVLLSHGHKMAHASPREVIDLYEGMLMQMSDTGQRDVTVTQQDLSNDAPRKATTVTTNGDAELLGLNLLSKDGRKVRILESESELVVEYTVQLRKYFDRPAFGLIVRDRFGRSLYEISTYAMGCHAQPVPAGSCVRVRFSLDIKLREGQYSFSIGVSNRGFGRSEFEEYSLLMHDVEQLQVTDCPTAPAFGGIFNMNASASVAVLSHA